MLFRLIKSPPASAVSHVSQTSGVDASLQGRVRSPTPFWVAALGPLCLASQRKRSPRCPAFQIFSF